MERQPVVDKHKGESISSLKLFASRISGWFSNLPEKSFSIALFALTFLFGATLGLKLNIPPTIDEVATCANAAYMAGNNWSDTLYTLGGYYFKYGPALFYYPLIRMASSYYMAYKLIMVFNSVIMAFIPVFAFKLLREFTDTKKSYAFFMALASGVFPSTVLYALYARADIFLMFIPWPTAYVLLKLFMLREDESVNKRLDETDRVKACGLSVLLSFLTTFAFMCHTRGIVVLLAVLFVLIFERTVMKRKSIVPSFFVPSLVVFFLLDVIIGDIFYEGLYGRYGTGFSSAESYHFSYLKNILTGEGFKAFLKTVIGTVYNAVVSTYGLVLIAVIIGVIILVKAAKTLPEERIWKHGFADILSLFFIVLFLGTLAMSCIYFFPYVYPYSRVVSAGRADWLVYGRYVACATGGVTMMALYFMIRKGEYVTERIKLAAAGVFLCIFILFIHFVSDDIAGVTAVSRNFIQLCTFLRVESEGVTTAVFPNIRTALAMAGALAILVFLIICIAQKENKKVIIGLIFFVVSITLTLVNYDRIRLSRDEILVTWTCEPTALLVGLPEEATGYPILIDDSAKDIKHYQFACGDYVCTGSATDLGKAGNCFIISKKNYFRKSFFDDDFYTFDGFDYENATKDIVYVKGEELYEYLTDNGYSLSKYEGKLKK